MSRILENYTIDEVFTKVLDGGTPYPHQKETAKALFEGKSVVLRAPCGSGKTEACYVSLILGRENLPNRLIYSLPTRALADEIASRIRRGISKTAPSLSVSAQHGACSDDPFFKEDIIVATIDQTIGAYCCTPLSLPAYLGNIPAGAAVSAFHCFDEAHIYDRFLGLQSMLVLIERAHALELPFLVMSATLPDSFVQWFQNKFGDDVAVVEGTDNAIKNRRERDVVLHWKNKQIELVDVFCGATSSDKLMIVCNTVDRAQNLYRQICGPLKEKGFNVFLLHSRFLEEHRKKIETNMHKSIESSEERTCLVTTQVCEVGLDISSDLLITEIAPPDSLIQRMGRCARKGGHGEVWVFDVENSAPYALNEIQESRNYVSQSLDYRRISWKEELEFVNTLLSQDFKQIMNDEPRRRKILKSLGDAAFRGSKQDVEKNVRELFNANMTIHDSPFDLGSRNLLSMPWIDVDARVLRKHLIGKAKFWRVDFGHDENGSLNRQLLDVDDIYPYEYYVVHPRFVRYTSDCGLTFGEEGESLVPLDMKSKPKQIFEYQEELWIKHAKNCLTAFKQIKNKEIWSLKLIDKLIGRNNIIQTEGLVALGVALHDLGKLNSDWQKAVGAKKAPLAHTSVGFKGQPPPHATISAYSMSQLLKHLIGNNAYAIAFELAIGHHHHTRAENVPKYELGNQDLYNKLIKEIGEEYALSVNQNIEEKIGIPTKLDTSFFDFEWKKPYTVYCIVARLIRLSDQKSFEMK